jgi:bacteriorhodopsin
MNDLLAAEGERLTRFLYWAISIIIVFSIVAVCCWVILRAVERRDERQKKGETDEEGPDKEGP